MENYQMGRSCGRPYRTTCGMNKMPAGRMAMPERTAMQNHCTERNSRPCECEKEEGCYRMPGAVSSGTSVLAKADELPPAMGYVPCQTFTHTFELCRALQMGTVFPELCKPFCGKRGMCR